MNEIKTESNVDVVYGNEVSKMEHIGILVVSYGSRAASMVDAFCQSQEYITELYIADRQKNPFNLRRAKEHVVVPSLSPEEICRFAKKFHDKIDFGIVGPEKPIIAGVRDIVEKEAGVPLICPTQKYAIEGSKIEQRKLFEDIVPEVNPRFKVFNPKDYRSLGDVKGSLYAWLDELNNQVAVKPDTPVAGKGVGVWGDHFNTRKQLFEHFVANFKEGPVIVEEKIEGEESSFQALCDGKHLIPLPETRDHKRAFDGDAGPNTGGMGSYKDQGNFLPFMRNDDWNREIEIVEKMFNKMKGDGNNSGLRGVPFYVAFMHTQKGPMILENNSRPGDPEIMNILPILKDDFVEVCLKMIQGSLTKIEVDKKATVATYKVPPSYGGYADMFPERVNRVDIGTPVVLDEAEMLVSKHGDTTRIYPGSLEIREDGKYYTLGSRTVCSVGIGDDLPSAREISLEGLAAIKGAALWNRTDIASTQHITKSIKHMERLRKIR
jgi:phosphoribosylamine--glycine ligase